MYQLVNVYKPVGVTPGQLIQQFRLAYPKYDQSTIGYAGRLDPLAHGVMLLMIDEATKKRDTYLHLPKIYECEALFGIETDTYDVLGLCHPGVGTTTIGSQTNEILSLRSRMTKNELVKQLNVFIHSKLGRQTQAYPPYSSKAVLGKPLFWWAKNKKLNEITIPTREVEIYNFELIKTGNIKATELQKKVMQQIASVTGDFRQKEIGERWSKFFNTYCHPEQSEGSSFSTARFRINCSSGTYVRGLVQELGQKLGCGAITLEILRTQVGDYQIDQSVHLTSENGEA